MPTQNINVGKGLTPGIKLIGNWDGVQELIDSLPVAVVSGAKMGQLTAAKKLKTLVKSNIRKGGPEGTHWPQYSPAYLKRKLKLGGNPDKKWRLTDTYYKSINITYSGNNIFVGVPRNVRGKIGKKPLTLGQIANILEKGSHVAGIQARPLWGPTLKQFGGKRKIAYYVTQGIRTSLSAISAGRKFKISLS